MARSRQPLASAQSPSAARVEGDAARGAVARMHHRRTPRGDARSPGRSLSSPLEPASDAIAPRGIRLRLVHPSAARTWSLAISRWLRRIGGHASAGFPAAAGLNEEEPPGCAARVTLQVDAAAVMAHANTGANCPCFGMAPHGD